MLSIGCSLLGCPYVIAIDVDQECLVTAQQNCELFDDPFAIGDTNSTRSSLLNLLGFRFCLCGCERVESGHQIEERYRCDESAFWNQDETCGPAIP